MRRWTLIAAAAGLSLAGCSTTSRPIASASTQPAISSTTSTSPITTTSPNAINPDVIPAVITIPYVDAVFKVLEHIDGNVLRQLLASRGINPSITSELRAIYNEPLYSQEVRIAEETVAGRTANIIDPPGDVVMNVIKLISASPVCIFVLTVPNYDAVLVKPGRPPGSTYFGLEHKQGGPATLSLNPTPWSFFFNAVFLNPVAVPNQCGAQ